MALIQPHFEINVALNGEHIFATAPHSIVNRWDLEKVYPIIHAKFPEEEGYSLSIMKVNCYGQAVNPATILNKGKEN